MQCNVPRLLAMLVGAALTIPAFAQSPEQSPARQQGVQATRYGTALGLPRDGAKLYLPDAAYPHFPLPPGNAYQLVRETRVVKLSELASALPEGMVKMTATEREQQIKTRAAEFAKRVALK